MRYKLDLAELENIFGCMNHKVKFIVLFCNIRTYWYVPVGVCPDVVTVGKPMGNGHPVSAVITSCDIAKKYLETIGSAHIAEVQNCTTIGQGTTLNDIFCMQYWGDPVSLAAVDAVLSVIEDEKLQENAKLVGDYILQQLKGLMEKHLCIGDVRYVTSNRCHRLVLG